MLLYSLSFFLPCSFELMDILTLHFPPLYCYLRFAFRCLVLACNNTHTAEIGANGRRTDNHQMILVDDASELFFFPECGHHGGSAAC